MKPKEFVDAVRQVVMDASVVDTISIVKSPPGRRPAKELAELSAWYNGLPDRDREMVTRMLEMVSRQAVFGMFAVLDGARRIEPSPAPKDHFELRYVHGDHEDVIAGPDGDPLHELLD